MAEKKFNEDLCEQVRQGKLAIENTDADRIIELMKYIFPRDAFFDTDSKFYYSEGHTKSNYWISDDFTDLPTRPVQDFFVPVSTPLQESPELEREAATNIPDGENDWVIGSETFTRAEVYKLLYTQRAMISNDIKRECNLDNQPILSGIINNPRTPKF
jgi:hypothetical protein